MIQKLLDMLSLIREMISTGINIFFLLCIAGFMDLILFIMDVVKYLTIPSVVLAGIAGLYMYMEPLMSRIDGEVRDNNINYEIVYSATKPYFAPIATAIFTIIGCLLAYNERCWLLLVNVLTKFTIYAMRLMLTIMRRTGYKVEVTDPQEQNRVDWMIENLPSVFPEDKFEYVYQELEVYVLCDRKLGMFLVYPILGDNGSITKFDLYAPREEGLKNILLIN